MIPSKLQIISVDALPRALMLGLRPGYATLILDVHESPGTGDGLQRLSSAVPVDIDSDPLLLPDVPRETPLLIYCRHPQQRWSHQIGAALLEHGYQHVWLMEGGFASWERRRLPFANNPYDGEPRVAAWLRVQP